MHQVADGPDELKILGDLGEGGMSVVHLAEQQSLSREVALKVPKDEASAARLRREAHIMGALEHPNIIPVHDLRWEGDEPRLVLKKVEGEPWAHLIHQPSAISERFEQDPLEWNLRVLMQVCRALELAHSRGFVHCDVNPSNVLVGEFGEVYLTDWGLAVALPSSGAAHVAPPDNDVMATVSHMAPEQLREAGSFPISPRTDVYLLGATLYEILSGSPPRAADAEPDSELLSKPLSLDPDVPAELAELVASAAHPEPRKRLGSAQKLRLALEQYLLHRDSLRLTTKAESLMERFAELDAAEQRNDAERALDEAEVTFALSLELWASNQGAIDGLHALRATKVSRALDAGELQIAARALASMSAPPKELSERLAEAQRLATEEEQHLRRFARDRDRRIGVKRRRAIMLAMGCGFLVAHHVALRQHDPAKWLFLQNAVLWVFGLSLLWIRRGTMFSTRSNRQIVWSVVAVLGFELAWVSLALLVQMPMAPLVLGLLIVYSLATVVAAVSVEPLVMPSALLYVGVAFLHALAPSVDIVWFVSAANLALGINTFLVNQRLLAALHTPD